MWFQPLLKMLQRTSPLLAALIAASIFGPGLQAQALAPAAEGVTTYRREVFRYPRGGRPDPFRSLLGSVDLGVRFENLVLRGIVFNPDQRSSIAVVTETGSNRTYRLRTGQRLGGMQVVAIYPRRVDVIIQELGAARRESLVLPKASPKGSS